MISERTKATFAAAKVRGRKCGNPNPATHRFSAAARKAQVRAMRERAKARALNYLPLLCKLRDSGETLHGIALQSTMMEIEMPGKRNVARSHGGQLFEYAGERKPPPRSSRRTQADRRAAQSNFQLVVEYFAGKTNGPYFDRGANR